MTKGLQKSGSYTNIKNLSTGAIVGQLNSGDSVFGALSSTGSDIINFDHYYKNDTTIVQLSVICKASAGNLTLSNTPEPSPNPTPTPIPTPTPTPTPSPVVPTITHVIQVNSLGQISIDGGIFS